MQLKFQNKQMQIFNQIQQNWLKLAQIVRNLQGY